MNDRGVPQARKLANALTSVLGDREAAAQLAKVLTPAFGRGRIAYGEITSLIEGSAEDIMLLASKWRLLIPVRTVRSAAWEDRLFLTDPDEVFEVLNVVRYLVENASRTGRWEARHAIAAVSWKMGDPEWQRVPEVVERMEGQARDHIVNAVQIREICAELGLGERTDVLIAEMKGMGVMSPRLSSFARVSQAAAPLYELNPSLRMEGDEQ
jgi:hypothetical protein